MSSIGAEAYGRTLTLETLNYTTLNPPIGGFVNNPLSGNLDCGGNDLTNAGAITTGTLNYTTLNPPIPTGFVNNPMTVNLAGGNFNIDGVASFKSATVDTTGNINGNEIIAASKLEGASGSITGNWEVGGNLTVLSPGLCHLKGGLLCDGGNASDFNNLVRFNRPPEYSASKYGTLINPIALTAISPASGITSFALAPGKSALVVHGHPLPSQDTYSTFEITTPFANVLEDFGITITQTNGNANAGSTAIPNKGVNVGFSDKSPGDNTKFQFVMEHGTGSPYTNQVLVYYIKLEYIGN